MRVKPHKPLSPRFCVPHSTEGRPHRAGHYAPSATLHQARPELDEHDDWPAEFAQLGAEVGLHTRHLDECGT